VDARTFINGYITENNINATKIHIENMVLHETLWKKKLYILLAYENSLCCAASLMVKYRIENGEKNIQNFEDNAARMYEIFTRMKTWYVI